MESTPPSLRDLHGLLGIGLSSSRVALLFSKLDNCLGILRVQSVHDVEKVGAIYLPPFRKAIRNVNSEGWLFHHHG